jgi:pimeloyl-ACP methyl ester carboxylesterase
VTDYQLPFTQTGTYTLTATVNPDKSVPELNYANNSLSSSAITLLPNFSATVTVDQQVYQQGETVTISGQTSAGGYDADVEVYMVNNGARNSIIVKADSEGRFQTTYKPYDRQSGHFVVGACYPNTGETSGSAEFDVYGLLLPNTYATHDISLGSETTGKIVIKNPGLLSQSGLQIEQLNEPAGCEVTIGDVSSITADGQVEVFYTLKATEVSQGNDWLQVPLRITSNEGSSATFTIYYFVRPLKGQLKASQTFIETTMTKGVPRDYQFQLTNVGLGETGRISLSLPSWIELNASSEIPSLNQGDTVTIALRMVPTDQMQLNVPISGQIGINCEKGDGVAVGLRVTPVSEEKGNLIIDVVDEYTYYAEGGPHVEGARVLVKHPTTGQVIEQGLTASDGLYSVELPEGWYTVSINADKHQGYQTTLEIAPGRNTAKEIFLTYEAITYSWEVVETEIEDVYEIETVVKYETNVPKPVIISTLPKEKPEVGSIIPIVVTNKGLIAANNVNLSLSVSDAFSLEWLTQPSMAVLAPQQTVTFYALLKQSETHQAPRRAPGETYATCMSLFLEIRGHYFCGDYEEAIDEMNSRAWGDCLESQFYTNGGSSGGSGGSGSGGWGGGAGGGGGYPPSGPGGWSNSSYGGSSWSGPISPTAQMCHEKEVVLLTDLAKVAEPQRGGCGETHIGGYILIPDSGPEYKVEGVAADGESKVRIVFSGEEGVKNVIPFDESCGKPHWTIKEGFGTLENADSWYNVVYKAPADYPGDDASSSCTVKAVLEYPSYSISPDGDLIMQNKTFEVPIKITRAPLALIHGFLSTGNRCWSSFGDFITGNDMYEDYQVMYVDYSDTHTAWFSKNEKVVQKAIDQLKARFICNGIVATKVDLIGHSMGGILARLHAQYVNNTNIHKLITVNTPHSGSPIANVVNSLSWKYRQILFMALLADKIVYGSDKISDGAIKDMAIGSEGTDDYLNDNYNSGSQYLNRLNDIPVHAVASYLEGLSLSAYYGVISSMGVLKDVYDATHGVDMKDVENVMDGILSEPHPENLKNSIKNTFKFIKSLSNVVNGAKDNAALIELPETFRYGVNLAEALSLSDCVVPYDSQTGGLDPKYVKAFNGGFEINHMSITENGEVWKHLKNLLYASVNDDRYFCKTGFRPNKLDFSTEGKQEENEPDHAPRRIANEYSMNISLDIVGDSLHVRVTGPDAPAILVKFSDDYDVATESEFNVFIPSTHVGDIKVYACHENTNGEIYLDSASVNIPTSRIAPIKVECQDICQVVVSEPMRVSLICTWEDGSVTTVIPDNVTFTNNLANYADGKIHGIKRGSGTATFTYQGLTCQAPFTVYNFGESDDEENSKSVCSTVTLKLSQTMAMTRQAFRGTLTMFNGNEHASMRDVKLTLQVTNKETGAVATSHEFQINAESIDGFTGEVNLTSGWTLAGNATGTATVLFIPTKYAAPTGPVEWSFGGTLSYTDPFTGLAVTRDLYPVTLTVKPSPELDLDYFLQRDVFGDDPLTEEVEPMRPAEFALLINNKGFGDATNVRMTTQQPQIIDNEKGLLINFEILSSQMNGNEAYLALGQSIVNDFGTIGAGTQSYAQWWLQSSLLGHFTEYSVNANHVTSYGNEDLSLLDKVRIHELIHGFTPTTGGRGFLVNDLPDQDDLPDQVYLTDATQHDVQMSSGMSIIPQSDTAYMLTVSAGHPGWTYGSLSDPTSGLREVVSVVRQSDGKVLPVDNVWQTDRTLRDGKDPLYENLLHFVGEVLTGTESYLVTFGEMADIQLDVAGFKGLPAEGEVSPVALTEVVVEFNKPILPETFTSEDLRLTCQGTSIDVSGVTVSQVSDVEYAIDLSGLTLIDGYYVLTVSTADITDAGGFRGKNGRSASWIQESGHGTLTEKSVSGLVTSQLDGHPVEGAVVTLSHNSLKYTGKTNSSGKYVITVADVSLSYDVTCTAEGYMDAAEESVTIPSEGLMLDFSLERGATIIMPDDGICTYSGSLDLDFTKARGGEVKAYYAKSYASSTVFIEETPTAVGGEGLILLGTPLSRIDVPEAETASAIEGNLLFGTGFAPYEVVSDDIYVLANKTGKAKFHRAAEGLVIPRHKAYIVLFEDMIISQNNGADVVIGDPTGLYGVRWRSADDRHYGVGGVPVHEKARGVHIQKGKKFIVK